MNRTDKPKRTSQELILMLKDEKGVTYKYTSEEKAEHYLSDVNNYLRTASYRKNYQKYQNGKTLKGKYIDLDFAYLQELSRIDMHLRNIITHEEALKKLEVDIQLRGMSPHTVDEYLTKARKFYRRLPRKKRSYQTAYFI